MTAHEFHCPTCGKNKCIQEICRNVIQKTIVKDIDASGNIEFDCKKMKFDCDNADISYYACAHCGRYFASDMESLVKWFHSVSVTNHPEEIPA
jgi:hypothetical protein